MATVNPWRRFQQLTNYQSRAVAIVRDVGTGTSVVELRNGTRARVRGDTVAVGSKAYIVNGQIQGEAPDLPAYTVQV
ncbi:MAG: hypothetical protein CMI02_14930 [Oceanospirillaceae bacterium]|nr:hypothetical protein [Oceanospirillaceae bacterium]